MYQNFENAFKYLNDWESVVTNRNIQSGEFLTDATVQGLRVTIESTIDLSIHLIENCNFDYVLTGKICQDPLEVKIVYN